MFDNVGKDLDEERNKRRVTSFFLTSVLLGLSLGISLWFSAKVVQEVIMDDGEDVEMIELAFEDAIDDAPPPPPPPPPPPAAAAQEEEQDDPDEEPDPVQSDDMQEDIVDLKEEVKEKMKSDVKPAGVEGGQEGGVEGGVLGGVQGGIEGGVVGGKLGNTGNAPKIFHHRDLTILRKVQPTYPRAAKEKDMGTHRCMVKIYISEKGKPYDVTVSGCPKEFHAGTKEAIFKWRWVPPKQGKIKIKSQTTIAVTYKLR